MNLRAMILWIALSLVSPAAALAGVTTVRQGPSNNKTTPRDWLIHMHDDSYYTESWNLTMRSAQGHILYINYLYTNIGVFSGLAGVNVSLTMPGRQAKTFKFEYDTDEFKQDGAAGRIGIGPNSFALQGRKARLGIREKKLRMQIDLHSRTDGAKFHSGRVYMDDEKEEWVDFFVHMPHARAKAELVIAGRHAVFEGDASIDHWSQNVLASDFASRWWNIRFFSEQLSLVAYVVNLKPDRGAKRWVRMFLIEPERVKELSAWMTFTAGQRHKDPDGYRYDTQYRFGWENEQLQLSGTCKGERMHHRLAIMDELGWAQRQVAKLVAGNPITYRLEGRAKLSLDRQGQPPQEFSGPVLMESIVLE